MINFPYRKFPCLYYYVQNFFQWSFGQKPLQLCPILWQPMDCSPQGASVHGILQARTMKWVAISFPTSCYQSILSLLKCIVNLHSRSPECQKLIFQCYKSNNDIKMNNGVSDCTILLRNTLTSIIVISLKNWREHFMIRKLFYSRKEINKKLLFRIFIIFCFFLDNEDWNLFY